MNVNGSRFHLLLGAPDWGRCRTQPDGVTDATMLSAAWASMASDPAAPEVALEWDVSRQEIRLTPVPITLSATPGEAPPLVANRRAAAADRSGNIYRVSDNRLGLQVWSAGSRTDTVFWPDPRAESPHAADGFAPVAPPPAEPSRFDALAVTEDDYLIAAFTDTDSGNSGLLAFDLAAGGPPARFRWQNGSLTAFDMATRAGGGVWLLDRAAARLWELDRHLTVLPSAGDTVAAPAGEAELFQPASGGAIRQTPLARTAHGIDLRTALSPDIDPTAIDVLPGGAVVVLDRAEAAGRSHVFTWRAGQPNVAPLVLGRLAHDIVVAATLTRAGGSAPLLVVASATGNEADGYPLDPVSFAIVPREAPELYPLRRFGGRALVAVRGSAVYDSSAGALRWVPVVQQPRRRFRTAGTLTTPVLDSGEPGCVWDRVILDATIPPGATLEISARSADDLFSSGPDVAGAWTDQPQPYQRGNGAELPWLRSQVACAPDAANGAGSWDLLLQGMCGRYVQLRLTLLGSGLVTPSIRAMRVWYPRFSYSARFLPATYREEPAAASFIERFLANFEGFNTALEDKIAQIQVLFDARTAPSGTLDWLAGWFGVALDASWDEWRRRLLIRHLSAFLQWRGTAHGLHLALAFAFNRDLPCPPFGNGAEAALFNDPQSTDRTLLGIRIVEAYQSRLMGPVVAGDPGAASNVTQAAPGTLWTPAEGNSGLVLRFNPQAGFTEQVRPFPLIPPDDPVAKSAWNSTAAATFGFVPSVASDERLRWQKFLRGRVGGDVAALSARHGTTYLSFDTIGLPADWPANLSAQGDWTDFCRASPDILPAGRWQKLLAGTWRRIGRLNSAWQTTWPSFDLIALPDQLAAAPAAQADWLRFEGQLMPIARSAHRFSVLLPVATANTDPNEMQRSLELARRIVELEKPAHSVFDVRFYWALNRVGEARLGLDTLLGTSSRAPELIPDAVLGRSYVGASFVGGAAPPAAPDRRLLAC
jgi:phage tail-like protein